MHLRLLPFQNEPSKVELFSVIGGVSVPADPKIQQALGTEVCKIYDERSKTDRTVSLYFLQRPLVGLAPPHLIIELPKLDVKFALCRTDRNKNLTQWFGGPIKRYPPGVCSPRFMPVSYNTIKILLFLEKAYFPEAIKRICPAAVELPSDYFILNIIPYGVTHGVFTKSRSYFIHKNDTLEKVLGGKWLTVEDNIAFDQFTCITEGARTLRVTYGSCRLGESPMVTFGDMGWVGGQEVWLTPTQAMRYPDRSQGGKPGFAEQTT